MIEEDRVSQIGYNRIELNGIQLIEDSECCLLVPAVIVKENIYSYPGGRGYMSAGELLKATPTVLHARVTSGDHPPLGIVTSQKDITGIVENPFFEKDRIKANLRFFKDRNTPEFLNKIKMGKLTDVSIGFYYFPETQPGRWNGEKYDFAIRDIVIDHVAAGVPKGKCPYPECGLGVNAVTIARIGLHPDETEGFIHIRVLDSEPFETFSLTGFDGKLPSGVRAKYGKYRGRDEWAVQAYIFEETKGWTKEKALAWVDEHRECEGNHGNWKVQRLLSKIQAGRISRLTVTS